MKCRFCNGTGKIRLIATSHYDVCAWCKGYGKEE